MIRPYDPATDRDGFWALKRQFELGLGSETGGDDKLELYEGKLTDEYRERYLSWAARCCESDERCITVAEVDGELVGYVFVLPETMAMIWDAAVLNELFVAEAHRGTGVADDLMAGALALARDQDLPLDRIVLDVDRQNDRAQAFYDRHEFAHWGELVCREL
ncbi:MULTISPECIES: GNAT family N-acetyltransferase [unclassified Haladaptatus]|uniref:GNAT family N-acetyltransferase n=1 Tax=unclassified Haladaptatus TaxID=2622732 RepID=UPI0023E765D1|nr:MULTISPECIES: GNAT family N-acetyltransferase [unclassified Haladaptatus]